MNMQETDSTREPPRKQKQKNRRTYHAPNHDFPPKKKSKKKIKKKELRVVTFVCAESASNKVDRLFVPKRRQASDPRPPPTGWSQQLQSLQPTRS